MTDRGPESAGDRPRSGDGHKHTYWRLWATQGKHLPEQDMTYPINAMRFLARGVIKTGVLSRFSLSQNRRLRVQSPTSVEAGAGHQARSARLCCEADGGALPRWRQRPCTHVGTHGLRTLKKTVNPNKSRTPGAKTLLTRGNNKRQTPKSQAAAGTVHPLSFPQARCTCRTEAAS
jgi:hypothetical protein